MSRFRSYNPQREADCVYRVSAKTNHACPVHQFAHNPLSSYDRLGAGGEPPLSEMRVNQVVQINHTIHSRQRTDFFYIENAIAQYHAIQMVLSSQKKSFVINVRRLYIGDGTRKKKDKK